MSRFRAVAVGTSLAAGLLLTAPGAAFAAGTVTSLSATQMVAALNAAAGTSGSAATAGWRASETLNFGALSGSGLFVVDSGDGIALDQFTVLGSAHTEFVADHRGTYENLSSPAERAAVRMMNRPAVRYSFTTAKTLNLATYVKANGPSPTVVLTDDTNHAGTQTANDDGSNTYTFQDADKDTVALTVDSAGVLTEADITALDAADGKIVVTFTYGAQHVALPTSAATISAAQLAQGVAYVSMSGTVKEAANEAAAGARHAAKGHTVKVASLRKAARKSAGSVNRSVGQPMVKVTNIHGGVKVHATNPWTHQTVTYTVKASGRKVIVHKA